MEKILEVKDLHIHFNAFAGAVKAIRGVNFHLKKGETLAIVGESGSGKSVTTKAVTRILPENAVIDSGEITYKGQDILNLDEKEFTKIRGNEISLIFQDPLSALDPVMKIGKQIMETLILKQKMPKREAEKRALELMKAVGIPNAEKRFNEYPFQFSGGMRQRVMIAIALACNPNVLIADEPTTALDVTIQAQIMDLMMELKSEMNTAIILVTHDLGVVANFADRIQVMYAGEVVERGTTKEIFNESKHPYTWALLSSLPQIGVKGEKLFSIAGTPPSLYQEIKGDAFAPRNPYAMQIDFEEEPPFFQISATHWAKTWLLDPRAPKVERPEAIRNLHQRLMDMTAKGGSYHVE